MQIIDDKALLLKVKDPQKIVTHIPKAKHLGGNEVLVKWGLEEAQVLKNMRIKGVPSPILAHYEWTGMYKPFAHQKTTSAFLTLHRRAFCFNEQGTGKTSSVIWAADYLMNIGAIRRVLVLCPLSIMESAWGQDLFKFAIHRTYGVAHSYAKEKRVEVIKSGVEFVIINYDGVEIVKNEIEKGGFDLVVVDECFVAGTLVTTPLGRQPIETLKAGDKVLTSDGVMCIKRLIRNTTKNLVEINLGNGETLRCTPDHPFFTDAGWVCAKNLAGRRLVSGNELSNLRAGIPTRKSSADMVLGKEPTNWDDLLEILRTEAVASSEPYAEHFQQAITPPAGETLRPKNAGTSSQVIASTEGAKPQTENAGRKRYWNGKNGTTDFRGFACGLGMELPCSVGREAARLSYELQDRLRVAPFEGGVGSRWEQPYVGSSPATRQEKRSKTDAAWVESVSYIECGSGVDVFNLEVEGTPNYFVGDYWLVHNCNAYKNPNTKRWKILASLLKPHMWVWMLTGTPAAQSPVDAYGLAKIINPAAVPKYSTAFKDLVMYRVTQFKWIPKPQSQKLVHQVLQPAIRFTKEECLDLPDMVYTTRHVPLTPQQERYYEIIRKDMVAVAAGEEITTVNAAANLNKLLQLSCGAVYSDSGEIIAFDAGSRMSALLEVIEEASHKVIIFVPFRHAIEIIAEKLQAEKIACEVIHGGISATKRTSIFKEFQTKTNPQVLVIQPQAAAHGVTLHAANVVVWWGPIMSIETYLQANARVHRAGQVNKCTVVHLQGSPAEKRVYAMLSDKVDIHTRLIDLYKNVVQESNT